MAARPPRPARRRPRGGTLERPVNARMYRGTWLLVGLPLLLAAFTLGRAQPLAPPTLPQEFDRVTARALAADFARAHPDRTPGTEGGERAADWVARQLRPYGLRPQRRHFDANVPGLGRIRLTNVVSVVRGRSRDAIVVMAHRDNLGTTPGANDNASGTAALVELARGYARLPGDAGDLPTALPAYTLLFVSTDGGANGGLGAAHFAADRAHRDRIVAVVNLDAIAGVGRPRLQLTGDEPRSPAPALVETAAIRVLEETGRRPARASALQQ